MDRYESQTKKNTQGLAVKNFPSSKDIEERESDLKDTVVEMKFLAVSWLDDFEKSLFDGKTVSKLLDHK